ncbi:MAG: restriction endonuclease subunit S [Bacteroidales bacterium]|nr:restriction endonuclease subunit S [Bacteroidales bacterium]
MTNNQITYKRLGDYIHEVNVRNRELKVTQLLGLSIEKRFIPSIANTIGTDMAGYKVVRRGQFAYVPVTSRNGEKITVALLEDCDEAIISQAYTVFEVEDCDKLLPEYLMMWFRRPEFDRYARFHSHGSAREVFDWDELCDVQLPVPSIERQREIVSEYETLTRRIRLNEQMIEKLEATAQALYRHTFVDNIDKQNLPQGWRMGTLGEISEVNSGKTCSDKVDSKSEIYKYPVAGASGVIGFSSTYNYDEKLMTTGRVGTLGVVNRYDQPMYMADNVLVLRSQYYEYCYQILRNLDYSEITKGGVQSLITQTDLKDSPIVIPSKDVLNKFEEQSKTIYSLVEHKHKENIKLNELQSLLLAKMGQL